MRAVITKYTLALVLTCFSLAAYADKPANSLYFLSIHFDPFITCEKQKKRPCKLIQRLRAAPVSKWSDILAQDAGGEPEYHHDSNYKLLRANLDAAKHAASEYPLSFVLVLGDTLGHNYRLFYRSYSGDKSKAGFEAFTRKTLEFVNNEFKKAFPDTSVFMVVGNNDTYSRNYQSLSGGAFFNDAANLWSQLILDPKSRSAMRRNFSDAGYYAVDAPGYPELRIIALNSVVFSKRSVWKNGKAAATRQLNWLSRELERARQRKQKVIIAMHIPTAVEVYATLRWHWFTLTQFWRDNYLKRFKQELSEFYPEVSAILTGHLHYDWNQSLTVGSHMAIPVIGVPSISPIFGSDPSFKIYHYALDDAHIDDYYTFYYPVSGTGTWGVEHAYNFFFKEKR